MRERSGIVLTEPYDPKKMVVLMVPGLQSTPFAFVDLMKTIRADSEVSAHVQVWTFLYATGTPVLFNALELRRELDKTIRAVDPENHDFATRHIVVDTAWADCWPMVSSSGNNVWTSMFAITPDHLNGNRQTIEQLKEI